MLLAADDANIPFFMRFMRAQKVLDGDDSRYRELAMLSGDFELIFRIFSADGKIWMADGVQIAGNSNLFNLRHQAINLRKGDVAVSKPTTLYTGNPSDQSLGNVYEFKLLRFITPIIYDNKTRYLVLSVDLFHVKKVFQKALAEASSSAPMSAEYPFAYFFGKEGWIFFESTPNSNLAELDTRTARLNRIGTLGRPGLQYAFYPSSVNTEYWKMVSKINEKKSGYSYIPNDDRTGRFMDVVISYNPLYIYQAGSKEAVPLGGIAYNELIEPAKISSLISADTLVPFGFVAVIYCCFFIVYLFRTQQKVLTISEAMEKALDSHVYETPTSVSTLFAPLDIGVRKLMAQLDTTRMALASHVKSKRRKEERSAVLAMDDDASGHSTMTKLDGIMGEVPVVIELKKHIQTCAKTDLDVLIEGETGAGKQLAAEAIHDLSSRRDNNFIAVNCAELDESLLLDTLFGHKVGAFTGADRDRHGAFLNANGGTIFLDEIQSSSSKTQQTLLRVLGERVFSPLGSDVEIPIDVRVICAANTDLQQLVIDGTFRKDLYYRLNVIKLNIPPLRERKEDIVPLVNAFLRQYAARSGFAKKNISKGGMEKLFSYSWPGNIRELKNMIFSAAAMAKEPIIQASDLFVGGVVSNSLDRDHLSHPDTPQLNTYESGYESASFDCSELKSPPEIPSTEEIKLTPRQQEAIPFLLQSKVFSRGEYENVFTTAITSRTANNDLKFFISLGVIEKIGNGPSTKYQCTIKGKAMLVACGY